MKKLLSISVIAALAVLPMAANAEAGDPTAVAQGDEASLAAMSAPYATVGSDATDANLATAGYVKGAYNSAIMAINKVADDAGDASEAIETKLTTGGADGYEISAKSLSTTGNVSVGGNETVTGTLGVTGATTLTGAATLNGGATVASGTTVTASGATITGTEQNKVTITNAAIDADDTTISDLETDNFKTGVIQTTVRSAETIGNDNTTLATEKAVRDAIDTINGAASSLTNRVTTAEGEIDDIQGTEIPVMGTWGTTNVTYNTINGYTTATATRAANNNPSNPNG